MTVHNLKRLANLFDTVLCIRLLILLTFPAQIPFILNVAQISAWKSAIANEEFRGFPRFLLKGGPDLSGIGREAARY